MRGILIKSRIKTFTLIVIALFLFFIPEVNGYELPEISWTGVYGNERADFAYQLTQTVDEGYALVGFTNFSSEGGSNVSLVKIAQNGSIQWDKFYGSKGDDGAYSIIQTVDQGYVLAGFTNSFNVNDYDFFLIKTNSVGDIDWHKTYGGRGEDRATSLVQTQDGGFALAGYSNSFGKNDYDFFLVKTDANGNLEWSKTYSGIADDQAWSLIQTIDGGFALAGETASLSTQYYDFWLVKTDENGIMEWNRTYGGKHLDSAYSLLQTNDGGFALCGDTASFGAGHLDCWLVKTDQNGTMEWNRTYGGKHLDSARSLIHTEDGGFAIAGYSEMMFYFDYLLIKTDDKGYIQCFRNYSAESDVFAYSLIQTNGGGYALGGIVIWNPIDSDFFLGITNTSNDTSGNLYPVASAGNDSKSFTGDYVSFKGIGFDPDGRIVRFRWDFDGDGIFDWESNTTGWSTNIYDEEGTYNAFLEVTDNNGTTNVDMKLVSIQSLGTGALQEENFGERLFWSFGLLFSFVFVLIIFFFINKRKSRGKSGNLKLMNFKWSVEVNKWYQYLLFSFFIFVILKTSFSLFFKYPIIYGDEFIYGVMAGYIYHGDLFILGHVPFSPVLVPAGYSYFLAPSYLLGTDMDLVYHGMLFINSIISSFLIFPVFFIVKQFIKEQYAFWTSILVGTLPIILAHNFLLLSENAFFFIFLITCYLVMKTFTYNEFNWKFVFYSFSTGISVGFLVMTRAVGVAALAALVFVFLYILIKNRKFIVFKYTLVFVPFVLTFILGFILYNERIFAIGYSGANYISRVSLLFSDISNFFHFITIVLNEINYFILMSYIIFMAFVIYLFLHWKTIMIKKKGELLIFSLYGLSSIFFLIIITAIHIYLEEPIIYSRYVSPGLPIIFILGVIGLKVCKNERNRASSFQISSILIILSLTVALFFPAVTTKLINNFDLVWIYYANVTTISEISVFLIARIFLILLIGFASIAVVKSRFSGKEIQIIQKICERIPTFLIIIIVLSLLIYIPSANIELNETSAAKHESWSEIARWFMKNDPYADIVIEDSRTAFSGGGMYPRQWKTMHVNLHFWIPHGNIEVMNRKNLSGLITSNNLKSDYIASTHDLTTYYKKIEDFYLELYVWPEKRQPSVDWHIYKIE